MLKACSRDALRPSRPKQLWDHDKNVPPLVETYRNGPTSRRFRGRITSDYSAIAAVTFPNFVRLLRPIITVYRCCGWCLSLCEQSKSKSSRQNFYDSFKAPEAVREVDISLRFLVTLTPNHTIKGRYRQVSLIFTPWSPPREVSDE